MIGFTVLLAFSLWTAAVNSTPLFREASLSFLNGTSGTAGIGSNSNSGSNNNRPAGPSSGNAGNRSTTNPFIQNGRVVRPSDLSSVSTLTVSYASQPVYTSCANPGTFAMTFDDGTQPSQRGIANLLNANNAKGTFFVNGKCTA